MHFLFLFALVAFAAVTYLLCTPLTIGGPPDSFLLWDLLTLYILCELIFFFVLMYSAMNLNKLELELELMSEAPWK